MDIPQQETDIRNNERFHLVCRTHVQYVKISIILFWFFGVEAEADFSDFRDLYNPL